MKVIKKRDQFAWVRAGGLMRQVNIQMVPEARAGDYVIVHAGFAIQTIDTESARKTLNLFKETK
ncbi:HypC/HybG/HupF family hydrogenase formation chaperone [Candidatus Omnitrophota bacterium]